jgi:hypothetical protein
VIDPWAQKYYEIYLMRNFYKDNAENPKKNKKTKIQKKEK